jgi:hypothetical protein
MLRFDRAQRTLTADTLRQLANIIFGAAAAGQLFGSQDRSVLIIGIGIGAWWVIFLVAVALARGNDRE